MARLLGPNVPACNTRLVKAEADRAKAMEVVQAATRAIAEEEYVSGPVIPGVPARPMIKNSAGAWEDANATFSTYYAPYRRDATHWLAEEPAARPGSSQDDDEI